MWEMKRLGDVCVINKNKYSNENVAYVGMEDIEKGGTGVFIGSLIPHKVSSNTFKFTSKHLLYGRLRPYLNKVLLPNFDGHCSSEIFPIIPLDVLNKKYLFYWLIKNETVEKINKTCTGARMPRANMIQVLKFKIPLPPLKTQQAIVAKLDETFAELEKLQQHTEQNLINANELFNSYLNKIFTTKGDDWVEKKLGDVCDVTAGQSPEGKHYNTDNIGLPFYQGKKEYGEKYLKNPVKWTSKTTKIAYKGDILMSVRAPVGPINISTQKICIGRGLAAIKAVNIDSSFLYHFLFSQQKKLVGNDGAVFNSINKSQIQDIEIPIPPLKTQQTIVSKLDKLANEVNQLKTIYNQKLKELAELKQSILEQAFNGKLNI